MEPPLGASITLKIGKNELKTRKLHPFKVEGIFKKKTN
jgi:hypothetical protein